MLQLREAWGFEQLHRFLIFDRDAKFCADVISAIRQNANSKTSLSTPSDSFWIPAKLASRGIGN